jgi:hypothetical protein
LALAGGDRLSFDSDSQKTAQGVAKNFFETAPCEKEFGLVNS